MPSVRPFVSPPAPRHARVRWWILLPALLPLWGSCQKKDAPAAKGPPPVPVVAVKVVAREVPVEIRNIGSVQAYQTVAIKTRVGGQIMKVHFEEGQEVEKDKVLFSIDRRPLEAALAQAQANLLRDQASLAKEKSSLIKAEADVVRYQSLRASNTVSEEIYQEVLLRRKLLEATVEAGQASVEAGQAAVAAATVLLEYTTIKSPIDGRTGDLLVDEGNVIKADDAAPLVVINQLTPIYVQFAVSEKYLPEIRKYYQKQGELVVRVTAPGENKPLEGKLTFLDNSVDRATGTIQLKGTFENKERQLWPGEFVDVALVLTTLPNALVVPSEAVQTSQQGQYVFVITPENTAEMRPVVPGLNFGTETVIDSGLKVGETVVTDGHLRLKAKSPVVIKEQDRASAKVATSGE